MGLDSEVTPGNVITISARSWLTMLRLPCRLAAFTSALYNHSGFSETAGIFQRDSVKVTLPALGISRPVGVVLRSRSPAFWTSSMSAPPGGSIR
ncbi:Uncharacterised protein [Bordetella trematum]|nr:Uncharacterised protein [Bordetella trematum]